MQRVTGGKLALLTVVVVAVIGWNLSSAPGRTNLLQQKLWSPFEKETNVWGGEEPFKYEWRTPAPTPPPPPTPPPACGTITDPVGNTVCDQQPWCVCA
mmetsp:Transcript_50420/g.109610  ORF Transcript_50420/g.109610 Transcript_50420/m.109610 type:complete len:98 (-) Transcript_50420:46-339(-)|eukprot:CAMPEP_0175865376 /NCGR_PEP_ID=MMETSP0107_2-20121207/33615_1 /TAXON_ID=195067 ORGANISM="Goniomonas pacifica, Strain CCMP1869" /NCGR_SAMPLE_ID=MMETSP0107_2 /ASSEMBLY_ACC=CAM_ASM_000203 /LENGTH=97 /DNA_ID=CAMNT_0017182777 /DNA_START=16 /DNA_END=309 /DNA_ORIENTATION=+